MDGDDEEDELDEDGDSSGGDDSDGEGDEDDENGHLDEDEDADDSEDNAYLQRLARESARLRASFSYVSQAGVLMTGVVVNQR